MQRTCVFIIPVLLLTSNVASGEAISLASLLREMTDRASLARFPEPAYT